MIHRSCNKIQHCCSPHTTTMNHSTLSINKKSKSVDAMTWASKRDEHGDEDPLKMPISGGQVDKFSESLRSLKTKCSNY